MTHSLLFDGTLELVDPDGAVSDESFWFEALADGTSFGEPQPVEVAINSLLRDGALTQTERDGNREVSLLVEVLASDSGGLQQGIAALHRSVGKRTTLMWTPPDGYGEPQVFDVETSSLHAPDFDDLAWVRNQQTYRLRLVCLPYWRSVDIVTDSAEGIPSVGIVVASGASTTGWSSPASTVSPPSAVLASVGGRIAVQPYRGKGAVYQNNTGAYHSYDYSATLTQDIAVPTGAYISFEAELDSPHEFAYSADPKGGRQIKPLTVNTTDGPITVPVEAMILEALGGRRVRHTWRASKAMTITSIVWAATQYRPVEQPDPPYPYLYLSNVAVAESAVLGRQVLKTVEVKGSARTAGAIHVAAPADNVALGQVVAFTVPQGDVALGFRPDLRQWAVGASPTTDATAPHGSYFAAPTTYGALGFEAPASMFRGVGYTIVGALSRSAAGAETLTVEASLIVGGTVVATEELAGYWTAPAAATWGMHVLGTMYLPPVGIQAATSDAKVRLRFKSADTRVDELYAFPTTGDLSIVDAGSGTVGPTASSHLWIDAPSPENDGRGAYWRGTTPTRADAVSAWSTTVVPSVHSFEPGPMLAFVASARVQGPTVTFDYHKRNF